MKKLKLLFIFILTFFLITNVKANEVDLTKKGSINITLKEKETNTYIDNAKISIYYIADISIKDNNIVYNNKICDIPLDDLKDDSLTKKIENCINETTIKYTSNTNNGVVEFNNLELGLYLVKQENIVEGYSKIDSFLVQIPKRIDNTFTYDIKALPKTDIYRTMNLTIEKKWNTVNNTIPEYIKVELYKDNTLIDTIKLDENNNWTYTFNNIEKSDKYTVKEINIPKGYTATYTTNDNIITITNTDTLPYTGMIFYPIIICLLLGNICILFGIKYIKEGI